MRTIEAHELSDWLRKGAKPKPVRGIITDLELDEISLVDEPAVPGAVIALIKRQQPPKPMTPEAAALLLAFVRSCNERLLDYARRIDRLWPPR